MKLFDGKSSSLNGKQIIYSGNCLETLAEPFSMTTVAVVEVDTGRFEEWTADARLIVAAVNAFGNTPVDIVETFGRVAQVTHDEYERGYADGQNTMLAAEKEAVEALKLGDLTVKEWVERARALMDEAADILRSYYPELVRAVASTYPERDPREVQNEIEHVYGHMEALL